MNEFDATVLSRDDDTAPFFAVLDGAQFDDLPAALREGKFVARSLYLDRGENNPDQVVTAPHLVWLDETPVNPGLRRPAVVVPALMELIGDRPAAVFWQCPTGGEALFRHLRGINMVLFPKDRLTDPVPPAEAAAVEEEAEPDDETHTLVLFRHADANVMAQTAPALSPEQAARLHGPATAIAFRPAPEWRRGPSAWVVANRPDGAGRPPAGPLRLTHAALDGIRDAADTASRERIASYLHDVAPVYTGRLSDADLRARIDDAHRAGAEVGLTSERSYGMMSLLSVMTGGELMTNRTFITGIRNDPRPSDDVLGEVFDQIAAASPDDFAGFAP